MVNVSTCRSEDAVKDHWNNSVRRKAALGLYRDQAGSIIIDIKHYVAGEVELTKQLKRCSEHSL